PEDLIYGKTVQDKGSKADSRDPRKRDSEDSEGDNDESDGDDSEREEDDSGDDPDAGSESDEDPDVSADGKGEETLLARKVEVTVDGEPVEVSVKEALEGYVRTETFHRRMNQLDEAKKIVRRAAADAVHNYEYSVTLAKEMEAHMDTMIPKEPNWDEEFQKDPAKARELQRYYEKATEFRKSLRDQMAQVNKKQAELNQAQLQAFAEEETSKFERMNQKNWSDPKKKIKDLQSMRKTGLSSGFTEEELSQVYDSRMLNVLLKASKYDRMMASKPKPVVQTRDKPVPSGAGSAKQRTAHKGVSTAMNRLNRTGSIDDAAVVFDQLLRRG
ncbi:MAG TPA: hypothetical protein VFI76_03460, partial [Terrimicrobiaceae bacterium]|nr:hypothetical protein [Terrimicrobiaceae bacterium]